MLNSLLRILGLNGFALLVYSYYWNDQLTMLVHPNYVMLILLSAVLVNAAGLWCVFDFFHQWPVSTWFKRATGTDGHSSACDAHHHHHDAADHHSHDHGPEPDHNETHLHLISEKWSICLFIVPIIVAVFVPPQALSNKTAMMRGVSYEVSGVAEEQKSMSFTLAPENRSLIDWLLVFNTDPEPESHLGQQVRIDGMVLKEENLPKQYFLLAKFVVSCCVADARPVGLPVQVEEGGAFPRAGEWVELEGKIVTGNIDGQRQPVVSLSSFKSIPTPKNPYVPL